MNLLLPPDPTAVAERSDISAEQETIYLRPCRGGGWSVHLNEHLLLFTRDEEEAFQRACEVAVIGGCSPRRMLLLSGPLAAMHAEGVAPQKLAVAAEQVEGPPVGLGGWDYPQRAFSLQREGPDEQGPHAQS